MNKHIVVLLVAVLTSMFAQAQTALDGAYVPEHNPTRRVVPYPHLRQADVMWKRRIWEQIDLRQKMNYSLYYPVKPIKDRKCLFDLISDGINQGQITAYKPVNAMLLPDDEFTMPMSPEEVDDALNFIEIVPLKSVADPTQDSLDLMGSTVADTIKTKLEADKILRYELKEDWIFDKQRSERYVRIIGIAPVAEKKTAAGVSVEKLFWLYFPECRYLFANADVFNLHNTSQPITFDDLFQKRMFSAFVVKEENVYDRRIEEYYRDPMKAILESERIKEDLFLFEHDLWHY
ncbi:MAG: gliding motility protein GldN [Bacteroidota bacterium]|jgi:gliding motility associated protien GldN